ncbi:hypothetical protein [Nisaea denitrificans]|uniref:hypothetical protein n=1 Tax=Nisaea denitrificans TaxID=390877 RepID=UPI000424A201|nr:hypothetical protein [Nisaea denitrificans]
MTADPGFDLFLGIDWSGAKGARTKGIQVAAAGPGEALPRLIANPYRPHGIWSRPDVLAYLIAKMDEGRRVLAGFDFAFCYAFEDEGAYFPGLPDAPRSPEAVWALVEQVGQDDPEFYGAALYKRADLPYRDYFLAPGWRGEKYRYRQRLAEQAAASVTTPHPVFKCIGAANVGTGSLAGMRLLHRLRGLNRDIRVWPFDPEPGGELTMIEIFPRLYYKLAGGDPRAWGNRDNLTAVCGHFGASAGEVPEIRTEDEADALIAAAALRLLQADPALWRQARRAGASKEGWIFGAA